MVVVVVGGGGGERDVEGMQAIRKEGRQNEHILINKDLTNNQKNDKIIIKISVKTEIFNKHSFSLGGGGWLPFEPKYLVNIFSEELHLAFLFISFLTGGSIELICTTT